MPYYQEVSQGQQTNDVGATATLEQPSSNNFLSKRPLLSAACGVGAVLALVACLPQRASLRSGPNSLDITLGLIGTDEEVQCAAEGANCLSSKCCVDGGSKGLMCYAKSDSWAECQPACEKGVHEGEKHGTWDATGTFHLDEWSCEELGKRSNPSCSAFDAKHDCPSGRCAWSSSTSACKTNCSSLAKSDICAATDGCMWKGECLEACDSFSDAKTCGPSDKCIWRAGSNTCEEGCWTFGSKEECPTSGSCTWDGNLCKESCSTLGEDACKSKDRCQWSGSDCKVACKTFPTSDSCPHDLGCIWSKEDDDAPESCIADPCSAPGEDCRSTKCCSSERGAVGMTCYSKDQYWAACAPSCGGGNDTKDWACSALGERSKFPTGCAWAGTSCAADKLCCNDGFECVVKDAQWTACTQTVKRETWVTHYIPIPAGWQGTVVGGGRREYSLDPAPAGTPTSGTRLYCFMAILPDSNEVTLMKLAKRNKVSVFACDGYDIFNSWQSQMTQWDSGTATLTNTDVFIKIWDQVYDAGHFMNYDWTVKVDADAVFLPNRLKQHLDKLRTPKGARVYLENIDYQFKFMGALEVMTREAVDRYLEKGHECIRGKHEGGEDFFLKGCLDAIGIDHMSDYSLLADKYAGQDRPCTDGWAVAYHFHKKVLSWNWCYNEAVCGNRDKTCEWGIEVAYVMPFKEGMR
mmetsp:Transcript_3060/g.6724  ORF Transcript_3060/g.6724 Transcript_3060/m.6724 type:complete len:691 (+) Transcript_3060:117-2189(+)